MSNRNFLSLLSPLLLLFFLLSGCLPGTTEKSKVFVNASVVFIGQDLNYSYESTPEITIEVAGSPDTIDSLAVEDIHLHVSVENIDPGTYEGTPVLTELPDGVRLVEMTPPEITVVVSLLSVERTFNDIPVELTGSSVDYMYETYPTVCDVLVLGPREVIDTLTEQLVMAYIDVHELEEGTYVKDIEVTVIPDTISIIGTTPGTVLLNITPMTFTPIDEVASM